MKKSLGGNIWGISEMQKTRNLQKGINKILSTNLSSQGTALHQAIMNQYLDSVWSNQYPPIKIIKDKYKAESLARWFKFHK